MGVSGYLQGLKKFKMSLKKSVGSAVFLTVFFVFWTPKFLLKNRKTVQNLGLVESVLLLRFFLETPCICKVYCIYHDLTSGFLSSFHCKETFRKYSVKLYISIIYPYVQKQYNLHLCSLIKTSLKF